jgi:iron complex transport system substrate-binding protein
MPARCSSALFARLALVLALTISATACARSDEAETAAANTPRCVDEYDPATDYFPDKVTFEHATGVSVRYSKNTKLVEIARPWKDADETFSVLLVQCGTQPPEDVAADVTLEVPVRSVATFSTTQLPSFALLGRTDAIVAHGGLQYASTPEVVDAAEDGRIVEVGDQTEPDVEALLDADPDVALLSAGIDGDAHRVAIDAVGVPAVPYADWLEETVLGRAEWLKVIGALTNTEGRANAEFARIEDSVQRVIQRAAGISRKRKVVVGAPFEGTWYMPAGDSYVGASLTALGAKYPWANTDGTGALSLDIETVIDRAADADVWIGAGSVRAGIDDLLAQDERFKAFRALRKGAVFAEDRQVNDDGGNALFELGAVRPDLVLTDLFKILYPGQAKDLSFTFYGPVGALEEGGR